MNLLKAKGIKVRIVVKHPYEKSSKAFLFVAGGKKRAPLGDDFSLVNVRLRFASGQEAYGVAEIDERRGCKRKTVGVFLLDGSLVFDNDPEFVSRLGIRKADIFPISHKISANVPVPDVHADESGWAF